MNGSMVRKSWLSNRNYPGFFSKIEEDPPETHGFSTSFWMFPGFPRVSPWLRSPGSPGFPRFSQAPCLAAAPGGEGRPCGGGGSAAGAAGRRSERPLGSEIQCGCGLIPINSIFSGMNIHKSQLFWCELQGYKVDYVSVVLSLWETYKKLWKDPPCY